MNLIEQLRTWDEIPKDDGEAFYWLDLKTGEAADNIESLRQQLATAIAACKLKDAAIKDLLEFATYSTCGKAHAVEAAKEALAKLGEQ